MAIIPPPSNDTATIIDAAHESTTERQRLHFGASQAGHQCERFLWYSFRWSFRERFSGRMLRLFRRGQNEEATVVADLRRIGCEVDAEENGKQHRVDFGNHLSGSMDGIIRSGLPASPKPHILEIKTHSDKSFKDLAAKGVQLAKPQHYAQIQLYMLGTGIDRALYAAVNKNDDTYYFERVRFDHAFAVSIRDRAHRIIASDRAPEPISGDPSWYQCKWCAAADICHSGAVTRQHNCRTCAHSTPKTDSTWHCSRWEAIIPAEGQYEGCASHVMHPDLVPWQLVGGDGVNAEYSVNGRTFLNGENGIASAHIMAAPELVTSDVVLELIDKFDATIKEAGHVA